MKADTIKKIDSILAHIKSELVTNLSDKDALVFVEWTKKKIMDTVSERKEKEILQKIKRETSDKQVKSLRAKRKKHLPKNYPSNLRVGDLIHINFGFGYCNEMSNGHYGIILSEIRANMYFVIPLSSEPLRLYPRYLSGLNLPDKAGANPDKKSYLCFGQIGHVSYRRLENIKGRGRMNVGEERLRYVFEEIRKFLKLSIDK